MLSQMMMVVKMVRKMVPMEMVVMVTVTVVEMVMVETVEEMVAG